MKPLSRPVVAILAIARHLQTVMQHLRCCARHAAIAFRQCWVLPEDVASRPFKVDELAVFILSRNSFRPPLGVPRLRGGAIVRVLFRGNFKPNDTVIIAGSECTVLVPAQYIVVDVGDPEIVASIMHWQLVRYGNPDPNSVTTDKEDSSRA